MTLKLSITRTDIIEAIKDEIETIRFSFTERIGDNEGEITDPSARHQLECFEAAIELLEKEIPTKLTDIRKRLAANAEDFDGIISDWLRWCDSADDLVKHQAGMIIRAYELFGCEGPGGCSYPQCKCSMNNPIGINALQAMEAKYEGLNEP